MDIRILIAAHKPYGFAQDDIYMPVQVGAALNDKFGAACDDTGDNISDKNPYYCELTGLYWMWKNVKADYCGLVHYRRYFAVRGCRRLFGRNKYDAIAGRKDIENFLRIVISFFLPRDIIILRAFIHIMRIRITGNISILHAISYMISIRNILKAMIR